MMFVQSLEIWATYKFPGFDCSLKQRVICIVQ